MPIHLLSEEEGQGGNGETFAYKDGQRTFYIKKVSAGPSNVLSVQEEYLLLKVLNLIGTKTPTEMALLHAENPKKSEKFEAEQQFFLVKRAIGEGESNKMFALGSKINTVQKTKQATKIDLKWAIRDLTINLLLNIGDTNIQNNHNALPIVYPKKENSERQKFIYFDPLLLKKELTIKGDRIDKDNFFKALKTLSHQHLYFNEIKNYLQDADSNVAKQREIVRLLQKQIYLYRKNKNELHAMLHAFGKESEEKKEFVSTLSTRLDLFESVLTKLSKNLAIPLGSYVPKTGSEHYLSKQNPVVFDHKDLEAIKKYFKLNDLAIKDHFIASQFHPSPATTLPKIEQPKTPEPSPAPNNRTTIPKLPPIKR